MNRKLLAVLAMGLILGAGGTAQAVQLSAVITNDWYNGNVPNNIPTPQDSYATNNLNVEEKGLQLYNAANALTGSTTYTSNAGLDSKLANITMNPVTKQVTENFSTFNVDGTVVSIYAISNSARNTNTIGYYQRTTGSNQIIAQNALVTDPTTFKISSGTTTDPFAGSSAALWGPSTIGFYVKSKSFVDGHTDTYYSESQLNSVQDNSTHMLVYDMLPELKALNGGTGTTLYAKEKGLLENIKIGVNTTAAYMVGFEDMQAATPKPGSEAYKQYVLHGYDPTQYKVTGDEDFNDVVFLITYAKSTAPPAVPEPATFVLMGAGLAGLWVMRRRNKR